MVKSHKGFPAGKHQEERKMKGEVGTGGKEDLQKSKRGGGEQTFHKRNLVVARSEKKKRREECQVEK